MKRNRGKLLKGDQITVRIPFDPESETYLLPQEMALRGPPLQRSSGRAVSPLTKKGIRETRFPNLAPLSIDELIEGLSREIYGQDDLIKAVARFGVSYFTQGVARREPNTMFLAGFPGTGKTALILKLAELLDLPIVTVNLRKYVGKEELTRDIFVRDLHLGIEKVLTEGALNQVGQQNKTPQERPRYILLFDELDKLNELIPGVQGGVIERPVLSVINQLLDQGHGIFNVTRDADNVTHQPIDIRGALTFFTMNFGFETFPLSADPRTTDIDDMMGFWQSLAGQPGEIGKLLGSLFKPDTASRMNHANFLVVKPLDRAAYELLLNDILNRFVEDYFETDKAPEITLEVTKAFRKYLLSQALIPAQGGRQFKQSSKSFLQRYFSMALEQLEKDGQLRDLPIRLTFDFSEAGEVEPLEVVISAEVDQEKTKEMRRISRLSAEVKKPRVIARVAADFRFVWPRIPEDGKIEEARLKTAIHEFGHAFYDVRLGARFRSISVIPFNDRLGGQVRRHSERGFNRFGNFDTGPSVFSSICSMLAAKAMERIFSSPFSSTTPTAQGETASLTTLGATGGDIPNATRLLYYFIHQMGMLPQGGTIDRNATVSCERNVYAKFELLPQEEVDRLGNLLRFIEDSIVDDFLSAHTKQWYQDKILALGRAGLMNEVEFYRLIDYVYPGRNSEHYGRPRPYADLFEEVVEPPNDHDAFEKARSARQSQTQTTARENLFRMMLRFLNHASQLYGNGEIPEETKRALMAHFGITDGDQCRNSLLDP